LYWKSKKAPKAFANLKGSNGYYFGGVWIPAGAGRPFQYNSEWLYCPSGNETPCTVDLVRIYPQLD
jgi:hypothetical protein